MRYCSRELVNVIVQQSDVRAVQSFLIGSDSVVLQNDV